MTDAISGPAHIAGPQITSRVNGSPVGQFPQVSAASHGYKAGAPAASVAVALATPAPPEFARNALAAKAAASATMTALFKPHCKNGQNYSASRRYTGTPDITHYSRNPHSAGPRSRNSQVYLAQLATVSAPWPSRLLSLPVAVVD